MPTPPKRSSSPATKKAARPPAKPSAAKKAARPAAKRTGWRAYFPADYGVPPVLVELVRLGIVRDVTGARQMGTPEVATFSFRGRLLSLDHTNPAKRSSRGSDRFAVLDESAGTDLYWGNNEPAGLKAFLGG